MFFTWSPVSCIPGFPYNTVQSSRSRIWDSLDRDSCKSICGGTHSWFPWNIRQLWY